MKRGIGWEISPSPCHPHSVSHRSHAARRGLTRLLGELLDGTAEVFLPAIWPPLRPRAVGMTAPVTGRSPHPHESHRSRSRSRRTRSNPSSYPC